MSVGTMARDTSVATDLLPGWLDLIEREVAPAADEIHRSERVSERLVRDLAGAGLLGVNVGESHGGSGAGATVLGHVAEAMGRGCSSVRSLLTVHSMVCHVLERWGTDEQRRQWLPALADGTRVAAFALSESGAGSDAHAVATTARRVGTDIVVSGTKQWTTFGALADVVLVVARAEEGPVAVLVETDRPGVRIAPISGLVGIRGSMTATVELDEVRVPADHLVGRWGWGVVQVAATALDLGRYTVAWGCVGLIESAVRASATYARTHRQFGTEIGQHQLVRRMLTDMAVDHRSSRLLCLDAGRRRDAGDPGAAEATSMAKYASARAATRVTADALQLHGANGCSANFPLQRLHGDATVMEVIEGTTQLHQVGLADMVLREYATTNGRQT